MMAEIRVTKAKTCDLWTAEVYIADNRTYISANGLSAYEACERLRDNLDGLHTMAAEKALTLKG